MFAKDRFFNGYSDNLSFQENFDFITSFIQKFTDKHIPCKTSRLVSSVPWITHEIRRKIQNCNRQMNLMVNLRMCSTKMSTAKSRSQSSRLLS